MKSIGLEYVLQVYNMKTVRLAELLGIQNPNIFAWFKRKRPIPQKRLDQLCEIFPEIPREYFQKELTESEKLDIKKINYFSLTEFETPIDRLIAEKAFENERKMIENFENYEVVDDIDDATHWIPEEDENCLHWNVTPNNLYTLYIDKYKDEYCIFSDLGDKSLAFLGCRGKFVAVEKS